MAVVRSPLAVWRRCDKLCTSGFVDDVIFHMKGGLWRAICIPKQRQDSVMAKTTESIPTKLCSMINTGKYTLWAPATYRDEVCYLSLPCLIRVQEISADECRSLVQGWKDKLVNCASGDHHWGLFYATK